MSDPVKYFFRHIAEIPSIHGPVVAMCQYRDIVVVACKYGAVFGIEYNYAEDKHTIRPLT